MQQKTVSYVQIKLVLILLGLLKNLFADFVHHSDFLKDKTQTFRPAVQLDTSYISLT